MSGAPEQLSVDSHADAFHLVDAPEKPLAQQRFNAFHLEASIIQDRMRWVHRNIRADDEVGLDILGKLIDDLFDLIEVQDCRSDSE